MFQPLFSAGPTVPIGYENGRNNASAYQWHKQGEENAHAGNDSNFVHPIVNQHLRNVQKIPIF
jgi:hypothetical protein